MATTFGENLIAALLTELEKRGGYHYYKEPHIPAPNSAHQNPDFVIVSRDIGVIVLEVKDWIKLLEVSQNEVRVQRRDGTEITYENPVKIAREYALNLADRFKNDPDLVKLRKGKKELTFPWIYAVALPNIAGEIISDIENLGIWDKGRVLSQHEMTPQFFEQALFALPVPPPIKLTRPLPDHSINSIRAVINPRWIIRDIDNNPIGTQTVEQTNLIESPLPFSTVSKVSQPPLLPTTDQLEEKAKDIIQNASVRLVRGVAGSGKSLVLAKRAQFLAEQHPDMKILVLAFNVELVKDLTRRIPGAANLEVINFHKLCAQILGRKWQNPQKLGDWLEYQAQPLIAQSGMSAEFIEQEIEWRKELELFDDQEYIEIPREGRGKALNKAKRQSVNIIFNVYNQYHHQMGIVDWLDVPRLALAELKSGHPLRHAYDVILIDEAQDFAPSWIEVTKHLLKSNGSLFLCDDPTQSLFRAFSWRQKGIEVVGRTVRLRVPFRSTQEITQAAYALLNADTVIPGQSDDFTQPDLSSYELASGERPRLVEFRDMMQEINQVEQRALALKNDGIPAEQVAILCHNKRHLKHWAHLRSQGFFVDSFNRMKGLEFRAVIIPHVHTAFMQPNQQRDEEGISEMRRRVFTAMTRAREILILSHHGPLSAEFAPLRPYIQAENGKFPSK